MTAANGGTMTCHGMSNPISFRIGSDWVTLYFMVMDTLGGDDMILGRDFLKKYDVLLDLARRRMKIRNPNQTYQTRVVHYVDETKHVNHGQMEWNAKMQPQSMERYPLKIKKIRKDDSIVAEDLPRLVYVEPVVRPEDDPTISVGRTLTVLRGNMIEASVANLDLERELLAKPENTNVRIFAVRSEIKRIPIRYIQNRNSSTSSSSSAASSSSSPTTCSSSEVRTQVSSTSSEMSDITALTQTVPEIRSDYTRSDYPCRPTPDAWPCRPEYDADRVGMSPDQQETLDEILTEFGDIFSKHPGDIGQTTKMEHQIKIL